MANTEAILAGISGALHGGLDEYGRQRDYRQRQSQIDESSRIRDEEGKRKRDKDANDETERQRQIAAQREIIESMPDDNPDGSPNTLKTALRVQYGFKGNLGSAIVRDAGQTARHEAPSGNVIANNDAAMNRLKENITFSYDKLATEEGGRNARWAAPSGNATLGAATTRRGQDVGATTARRGQDIGASTARRGQDLTFDLGKTRDTTTRRGQDNSFKLGTDRNKILKSKGVSPFDVATEFGAPGGVAEPPEDVNLPVESAPAPTRAPIPVTPRGSGGATPLPTPQNVSDEDIDFLAKSVLVGQGVEPTPQNIKTFRDRNRDKLIQQIKAVRAGGGG